jgi:hypothetical protein
VVFYASVFVEETTGNRYINAWTNFSYQDETWAEFSIIEVTNCMLCNLGVSIRKTA